RAHAAPERPRTLAERGQGGTQVVAKETVAHEGIVHVEAHGAHGCGDFAIVKARSGTSRPPRRCSTISSFTLSGASAWTQWLASAIRSTRRSRTQRSVPSMR